MTREDLFKLHSEICQEALELMRKKNNDYACSADPLSRISTFLNRGELSLSNESVYDAIVDMINYSVILAGLLKDKKV
jgi:hypothetical protein